MRTSFKTGCFFHFSGRAGYIPHTRIFLKRSLIITATEFYVTLNNHKLFLEL
jgi:hypothetical protein